LRTGCASEGEKGPMELDLKKIDVGFLHGRRKTMLNMVVDGPDEPLAYWGVFSFGEVVGAPTCAY